MEGEDERGEGHRHQQGPPDQAAYQEQRQGQWHAFQGADYQLPPA